MRRSGRGRTRLPCASDVRVADPRVPGPRVPGMTRSIKIGLLWHSASSGNLGVGALTIGNMAIIRQVAREMDLEPRFVIMGMRDSREVYIKKQDAEIFVISTRSMVSPTGFWSAVGKLDCVLDIGAGDSFADIYAPWRFGFIWATKMMTLMRGTPLLLSPQTIGPFTKAPFVQMARVAMNGARAVVVRDKLSLAAVERIAPKARTVLAVDVAFALPFEDQSHKRGGPKIKVGVNVSGLLFTEAETGTNKFGLEADYADLTRRFVSDLVKRPDVEVHLLTHTAHAGPLDDDGQSVDKIAAEFPTAIRVPDFPGPSEVKSYISGLDFVVAGRMHACVAAFSAGTPVIPIAYSRKFAGLFGLLDYDWILPETGMDTDQALAFLHEGLERRAELAADVQAGLAKVEAYTEVYRAELRSLFRTVSGGA